MSAITLQTRLRVPDHVVFRDVVGEVMLLHLGDGTYFGLDPVGTRIWQLILDGHDLDSAGTIMAGEFEASPEQIRADLLALVRQLVDKRLLQIIE